MTDVTGMTNNDLSTALAQLRVKLLDLSGRNRLINYKHSIGKAIQFIDGSAANIYKKLIDENVPVKIQALPEPAKSDYTEKGGKLQRPDPKDWCIKKQMSWTYEIPLKSESSSLKALMYSDDLARNCRKIEREAILAIEETGANMLFLAIGFLEYPEQEGSEKKLTAPLICIPVELQKSEINGGQTYSIQYTGDDVSENISLKEKLKNDFSINFPDYDDEEFSIIDYYKSVNLVIKHKPNFALKNQISLCMLSFTNMLLLRDIDPSNWSVNGNKNSLTDHPIVKMVLQGKNSEEISSEAGQLNEYNVEEPIHASIPLIYDADSSQHSAIVDVINHNKNMVIEGPPGTGKSQTITNLIAACIQKGKKVLFVAEKLVALEVVKSRLSKAGLGPFVLELHSNKSSKKKVLDEIGERIDFKKSAPKNLQSMLQSLEDNRKSLQNYVDKINTVSKNSMGLTVQQVIWRAEKYRRLGNINLELLNDYVVNNVENISEVELSKRMDALKHLGSHYKVIKSFSDLSPFWGLYPESNVPGMDMQIASLLHGSEEWSKKLTADSRKLNEILGDDVRDFSYQSGNTQVVILDGLLANTDKALPLELIPLYFDEDPKGAYPHSVIKKFRDAIEKYKSEEVHIDGIFLDEKSVTNQIETDYSDLVKIINEMSIKANSVSELADIVSVFEKEMHEIKKNFGAISAFCKNYEIKYWGSLNHLELISSCLKIIQQVPINSLDLQNDGLLKSSAEKAIRELLTLKTDIDGIETDLSNILYLDMLPSYDNLKSAVLTLRQGDAWYRVFQKDWRQAVSLHKKISINKSKIDSNGRLNHLHQLIKLHDLKKSYSSHSSWSGILDKDKVVDKADLERYLELTSWNLVVSSLQERIQTNIIDIQNYSKSDAIANNHLFSEIVESINKTSSSVREMSAIASVFSDHNREYYPDNLLNQIDKFISSYKKLKPWLVGNVNLSASCDAVVNACAAANYRRALEKYVSDERQFEHFTGNSYRGINTNIESVLKVFDIGKSIERLKLPDQVKDKLRNGMFLDECQELSLLLKSICNGLRNIEEFYEKLESFGVFNRDEWCQSKLEQNLFEFSSKFEEKLKYALSNISSIYDWAAYNIQRNEVFDLGLDEYIELLESEKVDSELLGETYAYCVHASIVKLVFNNVRLIGNFSGIKHSLIREEFQRYDRNIISIRGSEVAANVISLTKTTLGDSGSRVDQKSEMALINYLLPQSRPRMPVRKILAKAPKSIQALKPCFMMGPQAVAQYLTPGALHFDVVIMDEASQLKPEEAIGSIARGSQLVVVGDPKQLPPSSFFSRSAQIGEDEEQFTTTDAESILDLCSFHFQPIRSLRWHYRSQHQSLIAFSNNHFYKNKLVVFPSPYGDGGGLGVRAIYLNDAVYEHQTNMLEAIRIVDEVVRHMQERPLDSLGIVTLNIKQRDLIYELLETKIRDSSPAIEYKSKWASNGQDLFVKNLENVQGDERDVIYISTTFGKPPGSGSVRQNFGPISRQGGWRRLNVLFTRARKSIVVITSLRPEDIIVDGSTPEGTKALRNYLEFARSGQITKSEETNLDPDSDFEVSVIEMLRYHGYEVTPQLGVAGYRIDIAVKHPYYPGCYLAAVECDGATYHSALSVRDRDRIRQEILESLGWKGRIWRIWSTDWFRTPKQEAEKLIKYLDNLRDTWKPEHSSGKSWVEESSGTVQSVTDNLPIQNISNEISNLIEKGLDAAISINQYLQDSEGYSEVECNDTVKYENIEESKIYTVKLSEAPNDLNNGFININTPLAQSLLGAVRGDEVTLHIPGTKSKTLKIVEIIKGADIH